MMGKHQPQKNLFSFNVDLDERVRANHPLRKVAQMVDFSFVRQEVKDCYGYNGHVGLDPEVILKLMFLLFWDDIRSERELMRMLPERLDYLWFLGYTLDDDVPNHSVLSKARARWGEGVVETLVEQHEANCGERARAVIADSQYGTVEVMRQLQSRGIRSHMALHGGNKSKDTEMYDKTEFRYDPEQNVYICPAGENLYPRRYDEDRKATEYKAYKKTCASCHLRAQCTTAKNGGTKMNFLLPYCYEK